MRIAQNLLAWYAHGGRTRHALLLPIQSVVAAHHLLPLARLAHEIGIDVYYTLSKRMARCSEAGHLRSTWSDHATWIASARCHATRWTLIVVADHGHFRPLLATGSPIAHIGHGSPSKGAGGQADMPWEYAAAPRTRHGRIAYHEMIEASDRVRDALVAIEPALAPRIRVLGRLLDDELLCLRQQDRRQCLLALGLDPERPLLLAVSTLHADSLFGRYWDTLLPQLRALASRYQVVLCPHPAEHAAWAARLGPDPDLRMLPADAGTDRALAAAQMLVVDASSLCQKAMLLGIPMVLARCQLHNVWSRGATRQLYARWPVWDGSEPLAQWVAIAMDMHATPDDQAIREWVNSRPGQARQLYAAWLRGYFAHAVAPGDTGAGQPGGDAGRACNATHER